MPCPYIWYIHGYVRENNINYAVSLHLVYPRLSRGTASKIYWDKQTTLIMFPTAGIFFIKYNFPNGI
ncbi:hypothetical protein [Microseira wollei]|nr:hypothetical protein [Microseira wollei]